MRAITQGDVHAATRVVWRRPRAEWRPLVRRALVLAHAADLYRKRLRQVHPAWGNGTLAGVFVAGGALPPEPVASAPGYLEAMAEVIHIVLEWKARQNLKE